MNKEDFKLLFWKNIQASIIGAYKLVNRTSSGDIIVNLIDFSPPKMGITFNEAVDELYIDEQNFFCSIDIGVENITQNNNVIAILRTFGAIPVSWEKTRQISIGNGPFNHIFIFNLYKNLGIKHLYDTEEEMSKRKYIYEYLCKELEVDRDWGDLEDLGSGRDN